LTLPRSSYPVELTPPDISAYRAGNTGVPYMTRLDSGKPGPCVMVAALTHGNELCGALAVDFLFRQNVRPKTGSLILGFNNVDAFNRFDVEDPDSSRFVDEDFNRVWDVATLEGPRQSTELRRAREIRPVIDAVDFLLDIHSMQHATPPLSLSGPTEKGKKLAADVGVPATVVVDAGHAAGRRLRDYMGFSDPASPRSALLVECGQHWEKASEQVALESTLRFLRLYDIVDDAFLAEHLPPGGVAPQRFVEVTEAVTVTTDRFEFAERYIGLEVIPAAGTLIGHDGDKPVTTPYDDCVLIMPSRRLTRGQTAVRLGRIVA
jgi:predicted deacylase